MFEKQVQSGVAHVGLALREPEEFVARWDAGEAQYAKWVWMSLIGTAILGTTTYGMTMGILGGVGDILRSAAICTLAAGMAWGISLPTLYILNSFTGSQLKASTTVLAAIVTTSWGGLAMLASTTDQLVLHRRRSSSLVRPFHQSRSVRRRWYRHGRYLWSGYGASSRHEVACRYGGWFSSVASELNCFISSVSSSSAGSRRQKINVEMPGPIAGCACSPRLATSVSGSQEPDNTFPKRQKRIDRMTGEKNGHKFE
ncbi:MAG: hypothetical protein U1D30_22270 [Planctomycetota bacterium]